MNNELVYQMGEILLPSFLPFAHNNEKIFRIQFHADA